MTYTVEFKGWGEDASWLIDGAFDDLNKAMAYVAKQAVRCPELHHRITKPVEVMVFHALAESE